MRARSVRTILVLATALALVACGGGAPATPAGAVAQPSADVPATEGAAASVEPPPATSSGPAAAVPAGGQSGAVIITVPDKGIRKVLAISTCTEVAAGQYLVEAGDTTDGATLVIKPEIGSHELTGYLDGSAWALMEVTVDAPTGFSGTFSGTDDATKRTFEGIYACP